MLVILDAVPNGVWLANAPDSPEVPCCRFFLAVFSDVFRLRFLNSAGSCVTRARVQFGIILAGLAAPDDLRGKNLSQLSPASLGSLANSLLIINSYARPASTSAFSLQPFPRLDKDHQTHGPTTHLYPINRVHVLHTIEYDPPDLFESLVFPHA